MQEFLPLDKQENADLSQCPYPKHALAAEADYAVGDLHANPILLSYFLQEKGIINLSKDEYAELYNIYSKKVEQFTRQDSERYFQILAKARHENRFNFPHKVHFIGDTVGDRGKSDHFIFYNYKILQDAGVPFDVVLSNHDLELIIAYLKGKKAGTPGNLAEILSSPINAKGQLDSSCNALFLSGYKKPSYDKRDYPQLFTEGEIAYFIEQYYLPHLKLLSYSLTQTGITLYTHAPVDFDMIQSAAEAFGIHYGDDTPQDLAKTIDAINQHFLDNYIKNGKIINLKGAHNDGIINFLATGQPSFANGRGIRKIDLEKNYETKEDITNELRIGYILSAFTWNRPDLNRPLENRPDTHPKNYSIHYVHGHTPTGADAEAKPDPIHVINLDSQLGKRNTSSEQVGTYRSYTCHSIEAPKQQNPVIPLSGIQDPHSNDVADKLDQISLLCDQLTARYQEKFKEDSAIYGSKRDAIFDMKYILIDSNYKSDVDKLNAICRSYSEHEAILEKEYDPTAKELIVALKCILVACGVLAGLVPGLIAFGVFAKQAYDKTGSIDFTSEEANKTSEATKINQILRKS